MTATDREIKKNEQGHIGPYEIVAELGRGASATVFEARDLRDGRLVAVKVMRYLGESSVEEGSREVERFRREARTMSLLRHPNIVRIHETNEYLGAHYMVLDLVRGQTLRQRMAQQAPVALQEALGIVEQLAAAIDALHEAGMVHRDIKPSNIMLLPEGKVILLDFGIVRHRGEDADVTHAGTVLGSPAYMSPEQARGDVATSASDRWSLGVVLYQMLAGQVPFAGSQVEAVLYQITHEKPAPIAGIPRAVQRVVDRALAKAPKERYPTANALAIALRTAIEQSTVSGAPRNVFAALGASSASLLKTIRRQPLAIPMFGFSSIALIALAGTAAHRLTERHSAHSPEAISPAARHSAKAAVVKQTKAVHPSPSAHKQTKSQPAPQHAAPHWRRHRGRHRR